MSQEVRVSYSESVAKQVLDQYLGPFKRLDNIRPDWLGGMEIDRFYPTLGIAVEFQGDQHYRIVPGMHNDGSDFQRQVKNDTRKRQILESKGIKLYTINFLDLDRFKVINLVKMIVQDGSKFAQKSGNKQDLIKLHNVRTDREPDFKLMKDADRISRVRKTYYKQEKKTPWWVKILRKI